MDYDAIDGPDGAELRVPKDDSYRTCTECGGDCVPEPTALDGLGVRIAFVCPTHGIHSVIDPFADQRDFD